MDWNPDTWLSAGGAIIGLMFGAAAQRSRFCTIAALGNWSLMRDYRQVHGYLAALAVVVFGTAFLEWGGWVELDASSYRTGTLDWLGVAIGGLVFGVGAMLAGGCVTRTVVRSAEGNLGSIVALAALTMAGMATLFGIIEPLRGGLRDATAVQLPAGGAAVAYWLHLPGWVPAVSLGLLCTLLIVRAGDWRQAKTLILSGAFIGACIVAAWWLTGYAAHDEFEPTAPLSVSVVGPLTRGATYLTLGQVSGSLFGLFLIAGIFAGSFLGALVSGDFRWITPDGARIGHYLVGGAMMGVGAVMAGGCNIGQGLTGLGTLSLQSIVAVAAMVTGMRCGLWWLARE